MSHIKTLVFCALLTLASLKGANASASSLCETEMAKKKFPAIVLEYVSLNSAIGRNSMVQFHASAERIKKMANELMLPSLETQSRGLASADTATPSCIDIGKILSQGVNELVEARDMKAAKLKVTEFGQLIAMWSVSKFR